MKVPCDHPDGHRKITDGVYDVDVDDLHIGIFVVVQIGGDVGCEDAEGVEGSDGDHDQGGPDDRGNCAGSQHGYDKLSYRITPILHI